MHLMCNGSSKNVYEQIINLLTLKDALTFSRIVLQFSLSHWTGVRFYICLLETLNTYISKQGTFFICVCIRFFKNIYFSFRKTTLRFVSSWYTFIRYLELSLLKNLFAYFQKLLELFGTFEKCRENLNLKLSQI